MEPPHDMRSSHADDWRGLGDLVTVAIDQVSAPVEGMHLAIADRWFGVAGPRAEPLGRVYRAATAGVYGSVRAAGSIVGALLGIGAHLASSTKDVRPLWRSRLGSGIQAGVNAAWGDDLDRRRSHLRIELGLRDEHGESIQPNRDALAIAFPQATSRLAVMLHGLGETERCWEVGTDDDTPSPGLAEILEQEGFTPLLVRYNTGRRVSDNGASLAALLAEIAAEWPVSVDEIALIGNSMGGLVARSALHVGSSEDHWLAAVRHLVAIGTPHLGAPLEKGAELVAKSLRVVAETRPLADFIDRRSGGIKDLRFGTIREVDRKDHEVQGLWGEVDAMPVGVAHHFIAGVVTEDPAHPVGVLVGDLMVRSGSATGRGRRRSVAATNLSVLGGRRHLGLPTDPAVVEQIRQWISATPRVAQPG